MILSDNQVYIQKKREKFTINIEMPDGSRNYLHSQELELHEAVSYRDSILDLELDSVEIETDEAYYRLSTVIVTGENAEMELKFHSRKLNLEDAVRERDLVLQK